MSNNTRQQGYGCMGLSAFYGSAKKTTPEQATKVLKHAVESGVTLFNSATFYGPLHEEGFGANLRLLGKCLIPNVDRSKIQLMVKIGMDTRAPVDKPATKWAMSGKLDHLRADVDYALKELGVDYIDIIVLCRVPKDVTIEEAVKNMQTLVNEGKARHIALSEASAKTLERAAAVAPIYCIEQEWSLWSRDIEHEIVPTCRKLGIKIVAYSPLGRGMLTGALQSDTLDEDDWRRSGEPRFSKENFDSNRALMKGIEAIAERKNCSVGQLSLAWLHAQGPDVIPIPGTSSVQHLDENLAALHINLTSEEIQDINNAFDHESVAGDRYGHMELTFHGNDA